MTRQRYQVTGVLSGVILGLITVLGPGCNDPASAARIERRQKNLSKTVQMFEQIEAGRPRGLAWALNSLRAQHEQDLRNSAENPSRVGQMIEQDFDRWRERQSAYNRVIRDELKGDPDNIRRTAPQMAW